MHRDVEGSFRQVVIAEVFGSSVKCQQHGSACFTVLTGSVALHPIDSTGRYGTGIPDIGILDVAQLKAQAVFAEFELTIN